MGITYQLYEEARRELSAALELNSNFSAARRMLDRVDRLEKEKSETTTTVETTEEVATIEIAQPGHFDESRRVATDVLSYDASRAYLSIIQPLLQNRCGNASCHGGNADNKFRLTRATIGRGAYRVRSQDNLATVLAYIDSQHPDRSPLLTLTEKGHGPGNRRSFTGNSGEAQYKLLRDWVRVAAKDLVAESKRQREAKPTARKKIGAARHNSTSLRRNRGRRFLRQLG